MRHVARLFFYLPALLALSYPAMAIEEPNYEVIGSFDEFELRRYDPHLIAEVDVPGQVGRAGSSAFRILAGYIFGENHSEHKMAMTAPVTSSATSQQGLTTYAFVMERKYSAETLPEPLDPRIRIREVPARVVAVRRYSGRWTEESYQRHKQVLTTAMAQHGIRAVGGVILARYDSPYTMPFMRRNEVMFEVASDSVVF